MEKKPRFVMERWGKVSESDRSFDVEFWQRLGPEEIFKAAWEQVEFAHEMKGGDKNDLRLRRSVEIIQRGGR